MKIFALVAFILNAIVGISVPLEKDEDKSKTEILFTRLCYFSTIVNAAICIYVMLGW